MQPFIDAASPLVTFLLLIAVGLDLTLRDFSRVRDRPGLVAAGVLVPPLLLPPLAVGLIHVVAPRPLFASSLLLIVTCPIGGLSIAYSMIARVGRARAHPDGRLVLRRGRDDSARDRPARPAAWACVTVLRADDSARRPGARGARAASRGRDGVEGALAGAG